MWKRSWNRQAAADLRRAASLIEQCGWARNSYPQPDSEGLSMAAAMCMARFGRWPQARGKELRLRDPRYRCGYEAMLRWVQAEHTMSICDWNAAARGADDVIYALRCVAERLDPTPLPPLPVREPMTTVERRMGMRDLLVRMGVDVSDLPPLVADDDQVVVPDTLPAEWMEVHP